MYLPLMSRLDAKNSSGETLLEVYQLTVDGPSFLNGAVTIGTSSINANTIMNGNLLVTGTINGASLVGVAAVTASAPINSTGGAVPNISISSGTNGQVLTTVFGVPAWATPASGGVTSVTGSGNIASSGGLTPNITFTGTLATANGGTGLNTVGSNGQVLTISSGLPAWVTPTTPTAVTSVTGSGNIASSGGLTPNITFTGTLATANGGTGLATVGTNGQILTILSGIPAWATPTAPVTAVTGSGNIASSGGLTPDITFTGTLATTNGGTGLNTVGTNGQVLTITAGLPAWITPPVPVTSVTGSGNIASSGGSTPDITFTGTLATTNGGTGLNTVGSNGQVLTVVTGTPTWATPTTPVTAVTASGNIASSGGSTPNITFTGTLAPANGGTGLNTVGSNGQVLTVTAGTPAWATPTAPVTAVTASGNIASTGGLTPNITFTGTLATANGGTGLNTVGSNGQVLTVTAGTPTWATPTVPVTSVTASAPLSSSGGTTPVISIPLTTGSGSTVVLATAPTLTAPVRQIYTFTSIAYANNLTFTAAQFAGGLIRVTGATSQCNITTDTAVNLVTQFGSTTSTSVRIRFSYISTGAARVMNFIAGLGVTIYNSRNSNQNETSIIEIVITSPTTADFYIN